jgi:nitroimidazol reductase NimA-like FMN-containing flavoprotein (pyridoxamine 5'-phosphate oxidase superfamily)
LVHRLGMRRKDREIKGPAEILAIIEAADSCRLGLVDDRDGTPVPYVVAMNFGFEAGPVGTSAGTFWFHCAKEGLKLDLLRRRPEVCVQLDVDHEPVTNALGCGWGMKYASVLARGRAQIVDEPGQRRHGLDCLMAHYERLWGVPPGARPREYDDKSIALTAILRVDVDSLTAKRKA